MADKKTAGALQRPAKQVIVNLILHPDPEATQQKILNAIRDLCILIDDLGNRLNALEMEIWRAGQ